MKCFLCGEQIGYLRSLTDKQYCCAEHRREARLASARALRDEEDTETWAVTRDKKKKAQTHKTSPAGQAASAVAFLLVGALLLVAMTLPGPSPASSVPSASLDPSIETGLLERAGGAIGAMIRASSPVTFQQNFRASGGLGSSAKDMADWATVKLRAGTTSIDDPRDWIGGPHLASLRIWKRSSSLQNYQLDFAAEMEKTSLSWAFRSDQKGNNFYGTRLAIIKPGPLPNAGLLRYAVINGREYNRMQIPVLATLKRGEQYQLRVTVQDDHFITYLNGRVISNWTDNRLKRGGVGFFDDESDPQTVNWVKISERDSFLGQMLAHFSLFVLPGQPTMLR